MDSQFLLHELDVSNFECQECNSTDKILITSWKNGIQIECTRCGFSQFYRAEETKPTYEDGES